MLAYYLSLILLEQRPAKPTLSLGTEAKSAYPNL